MPDTRQPFKFFKRRKARKVRPFQQAIADNQQGLTRQTKLRLLRLHIAEATPRRK